MAISFGSVLQACAAERGAEIALAYPGHAVTWQELDSVSTLWAQQLRARGVMPDDLVAIALPNGVTHHIMSFAVWKAGATPCILPAKLPTFELEQILALAKPRLLIRHGRGASSAVEELDPADPIAPLSSPIPPLPDVLPKHWKVVASGGSTGLPKLIVDHGQGALDENLQGLIDFVRIPRRGVMLNPGPLYHNGPFLFTSLSLFAGSRVVGMERFDAEECLRLIERHRASWICLVPTMMHRIWSLPTAVREKYDVSSLQQVWHMAATCPAWLKTAWIEWLGAERIFEVYAGTEGAGVFITGEEWLRKPGSVGRVAPGTLSVLNSRGETCAVGEIGEIFYPAAANTKFHYLGQPLRCDSNGRFSLGDLGYVDEDGYLFLADRRTDLILRGGANIYPAEVEAALDAHPAVASCVVLGLASEDLGQRVHAIVQVSRGMNLDVDELNSFMRSRLSGFKCPETYEFVHQPLRDDAGKVRRSALKAEREDWLKQEHPFQIPIARPPAASTARSST